MSTYADKNAQLALLQGHHCHGLVKFCVPFFRDYLGGNTPPPPSRAGLSQGHLFHFFGDQVASRSGGT